MDAQHSRAAVTSSMRRDLAWADEQERLLQASIRRERQARAVAWAAGAGDLGLRRERAWWLRGLGLLRPHRPAL